MYIHIHIYIGHINRTNVSNDIDENKEKIKEK